MLARCRVHRVLGQRQLPGDVGVAQSLRDELEHVEPARRQDRRSLTSASHARLACCCVLGPELSQDLRRIEGAAGGVSGLEGPAPIMARSR